MVFQYKNTNETVSDSVSLLISILVRYPEVGTINYDPKRNILKFTYIISDAISLSEIKHFENKIWSCFETLYYLKERNIEVIDINHSFYEDLILLEIRRDVETLNSEEISLLISLIKDEFGENLIIDNNETVKDEDLAAQEELIGKMLDNIRYSVPAKKLIAFREGGRVLVFNK